MAELVLPDHLVEQTREYADEIQALSAIAILADEVKHWSQELKQVDEHLDLVWMPENITPHPAIVPGRFHIVEQRALPSVPNVLPLVKGCVTGDPEDDGFIEPGAWMFEWLRKNDHWSQRSMRAREDAMARAESARQRAHEREKEEQALELDERIKSLLNPGVSMHKSKNRQWTFRAPATRTR